MAQQPTIIQQQARRRWINRLVCAALGLMALCVWGLLVWHMAAVSPQTGTTNSDAATELLYARHMAQTGELVPGDWYFTTEVRLLHNSLVMAPLFLLTDNFLLVHTLACAIVMALLYAVGVGFGRALGLRWAGALLCGLLLLAPMCNGSFEFYQDSMYYSFFLLCSVLVWCVLGVCRRLERPGALALAAVGCVLSFVMGLCGMRYLEILFVPLACVSGLSLLKDGLLRADSWRRQALPIALCASGAVGWLAVTAAQAVGLFPKGTIRVLGLVDSSQWLDRLVQVLWAYHDLYITSAQWTSVLLVCIALGYAWLWFRYKSLAPLWRAYLVFTVLVNVLNVAVLVLVNLDSNVQNRYTLLPSTFVWLTLPLAIQDLWTSARRTKQRLAACALAAAMVVCAGANTYLIALRFPMKSELAASRRQVVAYLESAGWDFGYATYWNANVITLESNGSVEVASVNLDDQTGAITPFPMGCPHRYFQTESGQTPEFVLMDTQQAQSIGSVYGQPVYENADFAVYAYDGPALQIL